MKRSKQIQLVLITAALASCNRQIVPRQPAGGNPRDSTLTGAPDYDDDPYENTFNLCCQEAYYQLWSYSFNPTGVYYTGPIGKSYYYPGVLYRKGSFWRSDHFIVRGGWGKTGSSAGS